MRRLLDPYQSAVAKRFEFAPWAVGALGVICVIMLLAVHPSHDAEDTAKNAALSAWWTQAVGPCNEVAKNIVGARLAATIRWTDAKAYGPRHGPDTDDQLTNVRLISAEGVRCDFDPKAKKVMEFDR